MRKKARCCVTRAMTARPRVLAQWGWGGGSWQLSDALAQDAPKHAQTRLPPLQAAAPARRYERKAAGQWQRLDTKRIANFQQPGPGCRVIEPATHPVQAGRRCVRHNLGVRIKRVMSNNGAAYTSRRFACLLRRLKIKRLRSKAYTPRYPWQGRAPHPDTAARARGARAGAGFFTKAGAYCGISHFFCAANTALGYCGLPREPL